MVQSPEPVLRVAFYRTASGREPVCDWLRALDRESRRVIGHDIKTVQAGWPLGMPLVRGASMNDGDAAKVIDGESGVLGDLGRALGAG
jgi:hypothetical protein